MFAVEMRGITKKFGKVIANDDINLLVEKGEIHSLLGENGAGKTTLMKILFGLYKEDKGTLAINENKIKNQTPGQAFEQGLGMVHQHFMLIENMSVWENVVLGSEIGKFSIDRKKCIEKVQLLSDKYGFELDACEKVSEISVGMKQRVEILKTLYRGAEIIILDEPTAVLTPKEAIQLLDIMLEMKAEGKTIIFITHKLKETMKVADSITILRGGKSVEYRKKVDTNELELASLMVGHDIEMGMEKPTISAGEVVFSVQNIKLLENSKGPISFDIRAGEILGIAGVEGNGQQQLEELVMGIRKCKQGRIVYKNEDVTFNSVKKRLSKGIGYIPSDRLKQAILPKFSLNDNYLLGNQDNKKFIKNGFINQKYLEEATKENMEKFDVRAGSAEQSIGSLSGGNQQKVVLSREVFKNPDFVLACQPVRGLDIGAIKYIHEVLLELRNQGKAILLISAELTDLFQLSDKIAVLYKGDIMDYRDTSEYTADSISLLMAGKKDGGTNEN